MARTVSWFSCGAASAYATYLASKKYPDLEVIYCRVIQEHDDNLKFLKAFEEKTGIKIKTIMNEEFEGDIYKVFRKRKFIKSANGAPCTMILKKEMRKQQQNLSDVQIFGYTAEEQDRVDKLIDGEPTIILDNILIDDGITKKQCFQWLVDMGFELPTMYKLGYSNNNCVGCVKGGMGYWNAIRKDFPTKFEEMAALERELGFSINKEILGKDINGKPIYGTVFLDELDPNRGNFKRDQPPSCGFNCEWKQPDFLTESKQD